MGIRVGIDLGTTFSAVAKIDPRTGTPVIIKNNEDSPTTPSVLCFEADGTVLYGQEAKDMQLTGDTNTASFFKRSMGRADFAAPIRGRTYDATELSSILLKKLVAEAEGQCGEKIDAAVITVPAYFTSLEREATIEAGRRAGLEVIAIINEPTAAALAYGLHKSGTEQTVMIYDLGGGTFDVTLARITDQKITILGSDGDHELGGKDWDDCIARYLAGQFYEQFGEDPAEDMAAVNSLLVTAENVKKQLSSRERVDVPVSYRGNRAMITVTEEIFEEITEFLMGNTREVAERLLQSVELGWNNIDGVILVGGSTRMKMIHKFVRQMCGKDPLTGVNVDEAVALGAAIRANMDLEEEPRPMGFLSAKKREMPAIRGAKKVTDATAHALGMIAISKDGERYENGIIIPKNTPIPAANTRAFQMRVRDKKSELEVYVLQGHHQRPLDNTVTNKYVITKIQKVGSGKSIIDVTYAYNTNGVIEVSAVQKETGKQLPIRVEPVPEDMSWTDRSPKENSQGAAPQVEVILAMDMSGSMSGTPLKMAKEAAVEKFVRAMDAEVVRVGLVIFAEKTVCELRPTDDYRKVISTIEKLTIGRTYGYGTSAQPFTEARAAFSGDADMRYIVVLTDGCWSHADRAISEAKTCHQQGIEVMALGFGDADHNFLKKIASTEKFASLTDLSGLGGSFSKIAQVIGDAGITPL